MSAPNERNLAKKGPAQEPTEQRRQLAEMLVMLINSRNSDSDRVARLLHDEVGQVLSAVGLQLGVLRLDLQDRVPEIASRTSEIQKLLEQAVNQVRDLSYELNPSIVERAGLHGALDRLMHRFRSKFKGALRLFYDPSVRFELPVANALYKIAEQAVENAIDHGGCTQIQVVVKPSGTSGSLEIRDNGYGRQLLDSPVPQTQISYLLMKFYADQSGLSLSVKNSAEKGTIVRLTLHKHKLGTGPDSGIAEASPGES
jgi:signal transduction histidine kinase